MPYVSQAYLDWLGPAERNRFLHSHLPLGWHPDTKEGLLLPEEDRFAGMYVIGVQGVGKTRLLENIISYDAEVGHSIFVVDAHEDLTDDAIAQLPAHRLKDTHVLDVTDTSFPYGLNLFAHPKFADDLARDQAIERIQQVFEVLWPDVLKQQNLPLYLRMATIVLLDNPGATLPDMLTFLEDAPFRARLLSKVKDPSVVRFWQTRYDDLPEGERDRRVQPLTNRLTSLFVGRSLVKNILGQHRTSIHFRTAIENKEIVFIKLPVKRLKQDASLIGTILLSQLHAALFSFADLPQAQRPGFTLIVDECQNFVSNSLAEAFTEGRKFGVRTVWGHQGRYQIPEFLQQATMTARTKICFQVTPDDAREMAYVFPDTKKSVLPTEHACEEMLRKTADFPEPVQAFVEIWLRPLQAKRRGSNVLIKDVGNHPAILVHQVHGALSGYDTKTMHPEVRVADPTDYLDNLFYQVMRSGDPNIPLPREAVLGFGDIYHPSFYQYAIRAGADKLGPNAELPPQLLGRNPEKATEFLMHCIFSIREVMQCLAANPIGKESEAKTGEVARMLTGLPKRAAFIRAAETVGPIFSFATPRPAPDAHERLSVIQAQTRLKYCYPREDIEQAILNDEAIPAVASPSNPAVRMSRWEQL